VSTREEQRQARIARLLDQVQSAADIWVQAMYACGVEDGRGARSVHVARQRETAECRFRDIAAKLAAAVTPADGPGKGATPVAARIDWRGR
jgi:hypothetical protein